MIKKYAEEIIVMTVIVISLLISFSPLLYEMVKVSTVLPHDRYPLLELEYPPDMRVYLSRMQEGIDGKWLVSEKYTSEPHKPTIFHEVYLLMGKISGWFGLEPIQAFPFWRLICGVFVLISGYFYIADQLRNKLVRISAFILFVIAGNLPILAKTGIPLLGLHFNFNLYWNTFLDPVKRLFFLPHYTLGSGLTILSLMFISRGNFKGYFIGGFLALLAVIILPPCFPIIVGTAVIFGLINSEKGIKETFSKLLVFTLWSILMLLYILFSVSYFPWNTQPANDISITMPFHWIEFLSALGVTGWVGLIGSFYLLIFRKKEGYLSAIWVLVTFGELFFLGFFPSLFNRYRLVQVDFHLPLAVASVVFVWSLFSVLKRKTLFFSLFVVLLLLPSLITWPMSLRSQTIFANDKIKATYPLIPAIPYTVYPVRDFMGGLFWLKNNTSHDAVVLAGETAGSMIPAYSGNVVYLGHGHQTVNYVKKQAIMHEFYSQKMKADDMKSFLVANKISYVFFSLEESQIANKDELLYPFLELIFRNNMVMIYRVRG